MTLAWSRTWPDRNVRYDYLARDGETQVGRIYRIGGGPADAHWFWTAHGVQNLGGVPGPFSGEEPTKQAAADQVRRKWEQWLARQAETRKAPEAEAPGG